MMMTMTMNKVRIKTKYKDLSEIVEAAKRIERLFSPSHSQPNKQSPEQINSLTNNAAPGFPRGRGKGPRCYSGNSYGHTKGNCPEKSQKNHISTNPQRSNEVCRLWNKHQRPLCVLPDQLRRYGRLHNCNTCSKPGCKDINHANTRPPVANSCEVQLPQATQLGPRTSLPPSSGVQSLSSNPPLFQMPTLPHSSNELSVNLNRSILSSQVTSAGKVLQLPLDACCSVTLEPGSCTAHSFRKT